MHYILVIYSAAINSGMVSRELSPDSVAVVSSEIEAREYIREYKIRHEYDGKLYFHLFPLPPTRPVNLCQISL